MGVNQGQFPPLTHCGEIRPSILSFSLGLTFFSYKMGTRPLGSWWAECDLETEEVLWDPRWVLLGSHLFPTRAPPSSGQPSPALQLPH